MISNLWFGYFNRLEMCFRTRLHFSLWSRSSEWVLVINFMTWGSCVVVSLADHGETVPMTYFLFLNCYTMKKSPLLLCWGELGKSASIEAYPYLYIIILVFHGLTYSIGDTPYRCFYYLFYDDWRDSISIWLVYEIINLHFVRK